MQDVKLHYFPFKGLGEGIRMLLTYSGQKFEDNRISLEQWPDLKPKVLFNQLPILEADGKSYSQTLAICRFLGRKYGLAGEDLQEAFEIDQNMDFFTEIRVKASSHMTEEDPAVKKKMKKNIEKTFLTGALKKLDELILKSNGHIANAKLSWGDFIIAGGYDALKNLIIEMPDMDEKYPNIKKLKDNVLALPKVREYVASAPKTDF